MRFKDLPVGSVVLLGTPFYGGYVKWRKMNDGYAMGNTVATKYYNENGTPRTNFYPETSIHQWLNNENGFLGIFTPEEREVLNPFEIQVATPKSYRKEHGATYRTECFAALPSISQIILNPERFHNIPLEAPSFGIFCNSNVGSRTACGDKSFFKTGRQDNPVRVSQEGHVAVRPVICINPDANFYDSGEGLKLVAKAPTFDPEFLFAIVNSF